jgi:phosphoribosylformimino-5-aminoimidazole carboxamide ribonucleotide (ProFAR) isomerase
VLIPCIDLQDGQAVQLVHGRRRELAVPDVFGLLDKFKKYEWLHLIDLDAAMGKPGNDHLLRELCVKARGQYGKKVRIGGGVRGAQRAAAIADWGAEQVIIGSAVFAAGKVRLRFLRQLVQKVDVGRIVVALDTRKGHIVTHGWRRKLDLRAEDVMAQLEPFCACFLCTDVDREGTMSGANLQWFRRLRDATTHPIIAAGGIKTRCEISALGKIGMDAAVGMAMYKNRLR